MRLTPPPDARGPDMDIETAPRAYRISPMNRDGGRHLRRLLVGLVAASIALSVGCGGNTADDGAQYAPGAGRERGQQPPDTAAAIPASAAWTDTGIDLAAGAQATITARGSITVGLSSGYTPDGDASCEGSLGTELVAPGLPCWALIGRVGMGPPFFVGKTKTIKVVHSGRLFLGVNDESAYFRDNGRAWTVAVEDARATALTLTTLRYAK
jgi:hypothetical protein